MLTGRPSLVMLLATVALVASCSSSPSSSSSPAASADSGLRAVDVAEQAGIAQTTRTHGENCVADLNGDGENDLILSAHENPWPVYLGNGNGTFSLDPLFTLQPRDRHGCAVADYNGDGLLDVYFAVGAVRGTGQAPKELWIQQPDHSFVDQAAAWGIADPGGRGRVPVAFDANGDGLPDLFTGQETGVDFPSLNRLWINRGDHFELQADDPLTNELGNHCAAAADIDGDGLDELAVCTNGRFFLYRNKGGTFVDATKENGLDEQGRLGAEFADLNGDGRPDLVTIRRSGMEVQLNEKGRLGKPVFTKKLKDGKDVAIGDVDGDGDLDIYAQQGERTSDPDVLLLNRGNGREFTAGPKLPSTDVGTGDTVGAINDWQGTGRAAFIVNNGYQEVPGPRQLIEFEPVEPSSNQD